MEPYDAIIDELRARAQEDDSREMAARDESTGLLGTPGPAYARALFREARAGAAAAAYREAAYMVQQREITARMAARGGAHVRPCSEPHREGRPCPACAGSGEIAS